MFRTNAEKEAVGKETVKQQQLSRRKTREVLFHVEDKRRKGNVLRTVRYLSQLP